MIEVGLGVSIAGPGIILYNLDISVNDDELTHNNPADDVQLPHNGLLFSLCIADPLNQLGS